MPPNELRSLEEWHATLIFFCTKFDKSISEKDRLTDWHRMPDDQERLTLGFKCTKNTANMGIILGYNP